MTVRDWPHAAKPQQLAQLAAEIAATAPDDDPMAMPPPIPYEPQPVTDKALVGTEHDPR